MAWDRYAYVANNPLRFSDPSGHDAWWCTNSNCTTSYVRSAYENRSFLRPRSLDERIRSYGVRLTESIARWSNAEKLAVLSAIRDAGWSISSGSSSSPETAFMAAFGTETGTLEMRKVASYQYQGKMFTSGAVTRSAELIEFTSLSYAYPESGRNNVVHELGHVFNVFNNRDPENKLAREYVLNRSTILHDNSRVQWQLNPSQTGSETFADFFVAWTYGVWGSDADTRWSRNVGGARDWMITNMSEWIR